MKIVVVILFFLYAICGSAQNSMKDQLIGSWSTDDYNIYIEFFPHDSFQVLRPVYYRGKWSRTKDSVIAFSISREFIDTSYADNTLSYKILELTKDTLVLRNERNKFIREVLIRHNLSLKENFSATPAELLSSVWQLRNVTITNKKAVKSETIENAVANWKDNRYVLFFLDTSKGMFIEKDLSTVLFYMASTQAANSEEKNIIIVSEKAPSLEVVKYSKTRIELKSTFRNKGENVIGKLTYKKIRKVVWKKL